MSPDEILRTGGALGGMSVAGILGVTVIALVIVVVILWRNGRADIKEAAQTYIDLLREQWSDASETKALIDGFGKAVDARGLAHETALREARQEVANLRAEILRLRP